MTAKSILSTLSYHDHFCYSLSLDQIYDWFWRQWLDKKDKKEVNKTIEQLLKEKKIIKEKNRFALPGKSSYIKNYPERRSYSLKKQKIAIFTAKQIAKKVPWVLMIGLTGNTAMQNADEKDDIDLMLIAAKDRLWLSRLFVFLMFLKTGKQRRSGLTDSVKDKICINLWFDTGSLEILQKNAFTAHELLAMQPLFDRNNTYKKFIQDNAWAAQYWPNIFNNKKAKFKLKNKNKGRRSKTLFLLNTFFYRLQYFYMKKNISNEKIGLHFAYFHPKNRSKSVLEAFKKRQKEVQ